MAGTYTVEHRLSEIETFIVELPQLLNHRVGRFEAEFSDIRSRLGHADRAMTMLQTDIRDLRNGVARFMAEFDRRMSALAVDVTDLKSIVTGLCSDVTVLKSDVTVLKSDLAELKSVVTVLRSDVAGLKSDVAGLKSNVTDLKSSVDQRFAAQDAKLDLILARLPKI